MKNLKSFLILAAALLIVSCQNEIKTVGGGSSTAKIADWQMLSNGSNLINAQNNSYDALVVYAGPDPVDDQYRNPLYTSLYGANVTIGAERKSSSSSSYIAPEFDDVEDYEGEETLPIENISASDFHSKLRQQEEHVLQLLAANKLRRDIPLIGTKTYTCGENGVTYTFFDTRQSSPTTFNAKCFAASKHAYFLGNDIDTTIISQSYMDSVDKIVEDVESRFGPGGDVDGNEMILIIFFNMNEEGLLGYFHGVDKAKNTPTNISNEGDIFYINSQYVSSATKRATLETIAHEFQHMTFFNNKVLKGSTVELDAWLNEGLSMLSSLYCGYGEKKSNNYNWLLAFLKNMTGELSLNNWTDNNYGYSAAYTYYLNDVFGSDIAKKIYDNYTTALSGVKAVELATADNAALGGGDFNKIFKNFAQALYLSNTGQNDAKEFNFTSINVPSFAYTGTRKGLEYNEKLKTGGEPITLKMPPYSFSLIHFSGATSKVSISNIDENRKNLITVFGAPLATN